MFPSIRARHLREGKLGRIIMKGGTHQRRDSNCDTAQVPGWKGPSLFDGVICLSIATRNSGLPSI